MPRTPQPLQERFWPKVRKTDTCWIWTAAHNEAGYGRINMGARSAGVRLAHCVSYELLVGPIPEGMELDHTCHVHPCVNPAHLRPATRKQNTENRRGAQGNSQTGVRGVSRHLGKWRGSVGHTIAGKRQLHQGWFDTIEEAEAWVIAKRLELFTHSDMDEPQRKA